MIWPPKNASDSEFFSKVTALIKGRRNTTHALSFNETDGNWEHGGSLMTASDAAQAWPR
jgi:hypothetical protein